MKTIVKIIILVGCFFHISVYGQQIEKNSIICVVLEKTDNVRQTNIKKVVQSQIEHDIVRNGKYKLVARDEAFLKYRDLFRNYEKQSMNIDVATISELGKDFAVNYVCWIEVERIDFIYIRLINVETTQVEATAEGYIKENKLIIAENTNDFLSDLILPSPPPINWSDFSRLYKEFSNHFFLNTHYNINYGSVYGINNVLGIGFGGRHGKAFGVGYQVGIGLGMNTSGVYFHYSGGIKIYPYNYFFLSVNGGMVGMKKNTEKETINIETGDFAYYEKMRQNFYHGISLLGGADICFGKKTTNKSGSIINIAVGPTYYGNNKWGVTSNIGVGFVIKK